MVACLIALVCVAVSPANASSTLPPADAIVEQPLPVSAVPPIDPWEHRRVCESMFLTADWQLSSKQKVCDWRQNRLFSVTVLATATWAAATAQPWTNWLGHDAAPDGFTKRFGANLTQNAFKSTAGYLAGMIEQEDPRERPPFLILQETASPPRGVWRRIGAAVRANFVSYRCDNRCTDPGDVKKVAALSRMAGAVASGLSSELWNSGEPDRHTRAARGIASAYVATFVNSLSVEFKPELSAAADHVLTFIFGGR